MKVTLYCAALLVLFGCNPSQPTSVQMTSFKVLDQNKFEMCFNKEVEGIYSIVIKTKAGKEVKRAGRMMGEGKKCFQDLKMQHSTSSYTTAQTRFYQDSLINQNISSVKWNITRRYYEEPYAEGEYLIK
ncbi:hypothetical protein [Rufibacter tibetensis]|uniref:Lipoprotein n=1 Tax=Rufibacter tibetensis TaxID=512763 RepID=A0A0P0CRR1_9BACT|nr:hypothetical protein [Rufibacter tibetensis]ALJ00119.1 hypothetical protein DC20_15510 [Rufibacter tibetensis]